MRIRKKKWVAPFLELDHITYVKEPQTLQGRWLDHYQKAKLHLEIGAGKGDYWLNMAQANPQTLWVALEKDPTIGAMAIRKSYQYEMDNLAFIIDDAQHILNFFEAGEVDVIHLNFSDPWPKRSHRNRRLSSSDYINDYLKILKSDGEIIMKSDNRQLFEYSLINFDHHGLKLMEVSLDWRHSENSKSNQHDAISEYEQRFIDLGQPIYRAVWRKYD